MPLLALLLATAPVLAAERAPVPPRATPAQLQTALDTCKAAAPKGDRCFALQLALARELLEPDPDRAFKLVEQARLDVIDTTDALADTLDPLRARETPLTPQERAQLAQGEERVRRYWLDIADVAELIGDAAVAAGKRWNAGERYQSARLLREDRGRTPADLRARIRVAGKEALLESETGDGAKAQASSSKLLAEAQTAFGAADPLTLRLTLEAADIASRLGQTAQAERLYSTARAGLTATPTRERIEIDARYARHLVASDRLPEAEQLYRDVLDRLLAAKASEVRIARAYLDLARTLAPPQAVTLVERALAIRVAKFGENHPETARANLALARLYEQAQQYEAAEPYRLKGTAVLIGALSYANYEAVIASLEYGELLLGLGKLGPAENSLENARRHLTTLLGADHPLVGRAMLLLSAVALRQGKPDAIDEMERAVAIVRAGRAPTQYDRIEAEAGLAFTVLRFGGDAGRAYQLIRPVGRAALERSLAYRDFGSAAQREMRRLAGIYSVQVEAAWMAAQKR